MRNDFIQSSIGQPLNALNDFICKSKEEVLLFAPYIRTTALEQLDIPENVKLTIVTTLKMHDLWDGSSDIELFPFSVERDITIFLNNSIHLKATVRDWECCFFGSSNVSSKGLGLSNIFNYELNGIVSKLDAETIVYLKRILADSILMTDSIYRTVLQKTETLPDKIKIKELDISSIRSSKEYLISSLPMSTDVSRLFELINNDFQSNDKEETNCAIHDCVLFDIPVNLTFQQYEDHLRKKFFESKFILDLLRFIDTSDRYFGEVKEWIQNNCQDVPVPSRRDLTGNIQVLYKWIVYLSEGRYLMDRPNYSERIYRARK